MRQVFPNVYVYLGTFYHARREARRALLALGTPASDHETIVIDCACGRCHRPMTAALTFRFNPAGEPISHELFPPSSRCPDCGLALHSRNLLYIPAGLPLPPAEPPAEASGESSSQEECAAPAAR